MTIDLIEALPIWKQLCSTLDEGKSILISIPRYCFAKEILLKIHQKYAPSNNAKSALLTLRRQSSSSRLNYTQLWDETIEQISLRPITQKKKEKNKIIVDNNDRQDQQQIAKMQYYDNFITYIKKYNPQKIIILLEGSGKGFEENLYDLITFFHNILTSKKNVGCIIQFVASDDYSFWYYELSRRNLPNDTFSELTNINRISFSVISLDELSNYIKELQPTINSNLKDKLAKELYKITGGHFGLVKEVCQDLISKSWEISPNYWNFEARNLLGRSQIMEQLRYDIQEDPISLAKTALEFITPNYPVEFGSPRIHTLRQLGIIHWVNESTAKLCDGVIKQLIEQIGRTNSINRLGTVESNTGIKRFDENEFTLNDDDIVVIHISDLHIGEDYAFRFTCQGKVFNDGKESLAIILNNDLKNLGLEKQVDCLVISGDIVCCGTHDEFMRAEKIIMDILNTISLSKEKLVIVAGNHDLNWKPSEFAEIMLSNNKVSREPYDNFVKKLGKNIKNPLVELTSIISKSGRKKLRILAIDSNYVEGPNSSGIGYIPKEVLHIARDLLDKDEVSESHEKIYNWIITHHHIFPVGSVFLDAARQKDVSVMGNAPEILNNAIQWNVELILHGHQHQPSVIKAECWLGGSSKLNFSPIAVVGAGSCSAKRELLGPVSRNHYYIIIRRKDEIIIRSRIMGEEGLSFMANNDLSL